MNYSADIRFNDQGVPVSNQFDDIYFSVDNGVAESRYVFLQHNNLAERFAKLPEHSEFVVAETGFGSGLNFLLCWQLFLQTAPASCRLVFASFEKYPLSREQLQQAYQVLAELQPLAEQLLAVYPSTEPGCHRVLLADGRVTLDLWVGDINEQLPRFSRSAESQVDCWFLDGFAPAKNPHMWQPALFRQMACCAHAATTFATFTAAGVVRRGLAEAGFRVEKAPGFGRKREMICGRLLTDKATKPALQRQPVTVIGAGIAAATLTLALKRRGVPVSVISSQVADGASGNPQGAVYPLLHAERTPLSQFYLQAFSTAVSFYYPWQGQHWFPCGVLQPAFNPQRRQRIDKVAGGLYQLQSVSHAVSEQADQLAGIAVNFDSLHYPAGGWLRPQTLVELLFQQADCQPVRQTVSADMPRPAGRLVIAAGKQSAALSEQLAGIKLPIKPVRGQITLVKASPATAALQQVLCYKGYMIPADNGQHCIGATFNRGDDSAVSRAEDDNDNLASLQTCSQQPWSESLPVVGQRTSVRATSPDHMPIAGQLADKLLLISALGSRGLTSAPLLAEIIAAQLTGGLVPLADDCLRRLSPQRYR
ncbi:bifunctional tRNA (5-methylaminomethyl-2-thiouridine)(34)-methyltransferase MnmD/FAD-dependent 5-carboxymethylaminomethyl-2-thiouridine(34) oxidoreductase MnmC [Idiomarina seosinensis]|uniref:bifunctional tRNA (5-methylaminomethyl-2-thiouridine)(34)-methyltransferase MnmD/FAD-dependent 5-carboxymethylaminomethyl-2-thiouridine(34) oxidoreductase MnmC n=1 Tax=Idiomarina seosinensis TaxID=281739 RepID=UPI00384B87EF